MKNKITDIWLLRIAVVYMLFQLTWWAIQLTRLHQEVYEQEQRIELLNGNAPSITQNYLQRKMWMIAGEALVFVLIMSYLFYKVRKAYLRELRNIQQQKNFILSTTHELKTPIASNRLLLETVLMRADLAEEKKKDILNKALKENLRLEKLIQNLLFIGSVDQSNFNLEAQEVNISELITPLLQEYRTQIDIQFTTAPLQLVADPNLLLSVFRNLIENAIKYNDQSAKKLSIVIKDRQLIFTDNGIGIAKEDMKYIFDLFYRSGDENTRKTQGTGIGLYLCQQILQLHEAKIEVNTNLKEGSQFIITF